MTEYVKDDISDINTRPAVNGDGGEGGGGDLLFSAAPPKQKLVVDSGYLDSLWTWVVQDNGILVNQAEPVAPKPTTGKDHIEFVLQHASERLCATDNMVWQTLTGHGVDWKRVPKLEFQCLCIIGAHGKSGVLQPDVVRLSGQDKRSVPKRTDSLASKGYITKESCLGSGAKTSLLRLKKFAQLGNSIESKVQSDSARIKNDDNVTSVVRYDQWYELIIAELKKKNDNIMLLDTLCDVAVSTFSMFTLRDRRLRYCRVSLGADYHVVH